MSREKRGRRSASRNRMKARNSSGERRSLSRDNYTLLSSRGRQRDI